MRLVFLAVFVMAVGVLLAGCGTGVVGIADCRITNIGADAKRDANGQLIHIYDYRFVHDGGVCEDIVVHGEWNDGTDVATEQLTHPKQGAFTSRWRCPSDPWIDANAVCTVMGSEKGNLLGMSPAQSAIVSTLDNFSAPLGALMVENQIDRDSLKGQLGNALKKLEADEKKAAATGPDALLDYGGCACGDNEPAPVDKPNNPPIPNPGTGSNTGAVVAKGSQGPKVEAIQHLLNQTGAGILVDGDFGEQTEDAIRDLQKNRDFPPAERDGRVGAKTWPLLWVSPLGKGAPQEDAVKALQTLLLFNGFGAGMPVDGDFGDVTNDAVNAFRRAKNIQETGAVGPQTWAALVSK